MEHITLKDLAAILDAGYTVTKRDPALLGAVLGTSAEKRARNVDAAYMICDLTDDTEGYLLIGDDLPAMLLEARRHLGL